METKPLALIKPRYLIICILFFWANNAFCQLIPISLQQRIDSAAVIFEGKVTGQTSFWNTSHTQIYTSNTVEVYKVFKGSLTVQQVEIITRGGTVGKDMEQVTHTLQLTVGDVGVFTAIANKAKLSQDSKLMRLKAYAGLQGFIKYNLNDHSANDPFTHYKSITNDVYPSITRRTNTSIKVIKTADFKVQ